MNDAAQHARETLFHDKLAETLNEKVDFRMAFESPTAMENQYI